MGQEPEPDRVALVWFVLAVIPAVLLILAVWARGVGV